MIDSDMKKITNLLYMLAVLLLASCSDFLDKSPKIRLTRNDGDR